MRFLITGAGFVLAAISAFSGVRREVDLDFIRNALRQGRFSAALHRLRRLPEKADARTLTLQSRAWVGLRGWLQALDCSRRALLIDPGYPQALRVRGMLLLRLRRAREALPLFRLLLRITPGDPFVLQQLSTVCCRLGRYQEAADFCRRALRVSSNRWNCYRMGYIFERTGAYGRARLWYRRALALGLRPRRGREHLLARVCWKMGMALKQNGKIEAALASFLRIRRWYPGTPYARAATVQIDALRRLLRVLLRQGSSAD